MERERLRYPAGHCGCPISSHSWSSQVFPPSAEAKGGSRASGRVRGQALEVSDDASHKINVYEQEATNHNR